MKTGIDSYCYHRYFGEIYEDIEKAPKYTMTLEDFLRRAIKLKVDGVSLETCFIPSFEETYLKRIKEIIDEGGLEAVLAWGHPDGLEGGRNPEAVRDMEDQFRTCEILGVDVLRIVGSSLSFRNEPHMPQIEKITGLLREPLKKAQDKGIRLAIENHFDFTVDEYITMLNNIDSDYFGMTFDTGNCLRNGDEPVEAARKLAKYIFATHTKDVAPQYGGDPKDWTYYACTPLGKGIINIPGVVDVLEESGYKGLIAVEIDYLHPEYGDNTDKAVVESIDFLKKLNKKYKN